MIVAVALRLAVMFAAQGGLGMPAAQQGPCALPAALCCSSLQGWHTPSKAPCPRLQLWHVPVMLVQLLQLESGQPTHFPSLVA